MNGKMYVGALLVCVMLCVGFTHVSLGAQAKEQEPKTEKTYDFCGTHFFASYKECDSVALKDIETFKNIFSDAVRASGATILEFSFTNFGPESMTGTFTLSESHASIHTYPEHNACFVDLFTCGSHCHWEPFHVILTAYLKPKTVSSEVVVRN